MAGVIITCAVISACSSSNNSGGSLNKGKASSGDADFSKYVAIGDSLTAGYADGALYLFGQQNSFPAVLAKQFAEVGGGAFEQPLVSDNFGGLVFDGAPILDSDGNDRFENRLVLNTDPDPTMEGELPSPERLAGTATTEVNGSGLTGEFNNMGVPGAKSFHLLAAGLGNPAGVLPELSNPYFARFASAPGAVLIADAAMQQPSFFTLWIGNNDVLSFATSGGVGVDQLGNPDIAGDIDPNNKYGSNDITDPTAFAGVYAQIVGALTANPATKGVLINIPDVSTIPFFTTVPFNPVPLDQASADGLNAAFAAYNAGVQSLVGIAPGLTQEEADARTLTFVAGEENALLIIDEDLTDLTQINPPSTLPLINMRQATNDDLIILPTSAKIGELVDPNDDPKDPTSPRWGISGALEDGDVLTADEIQAIDTARTAFNATIKAAADADPNLVLLDASALMTQLSTAEGIDFGTGSINSKFATGGAFSLDGVHPTARGYAFIADSIIDEINAGFNANVFKVDPALSTTIFLK
ncbi:MAG TPA: G-D-S-L family lipolytic protein [Gammaproteobacteria bacterium]|nr:G-D-S-L family lipolytic protein [Gammaproteobacteria bacterium]